MTSALEVLDLGVRVGERAILDGVSLSLAAGECVALVGPNGAGKSTLLRAILGLLKPTHGEVRWRGRSVRKLSGRERASAMAWR